MTLPERLHHILVKLREGFDTDLPDPAELEHTGELQIRGQMFTVASNVLLGELAQSNKFTIYLHSRPGEAMEGEHLLYLHFEGRHEISSVTVKLDMVEGNIRQNVTMSSLPREIFLQRVERHLGRGAPREKRNRGGGGGGGPRGGGGGGGYGGRGGFRPRPAPMENEDSDSM